MAAAASIEAQHQGQQLEDLTSEHTGVRIPIPAQIAQVAHTVETLVATAGASQAGATTKHADERTSNHRAPPAHPSAPSTREVEAHSDQAPKTEPLRFASAPTRPEPTPPPLVEPAAIAIPPAMRPEGQSISTTVDDALNRASASKARAHASLAKAEQDAPSDIATLSTISPRIAELERATRRSRNPDLTSVNAGALIKLDGLVHEIRHEVTSNPLWLAADHVARNPGLLRAEDLVRESAALKQAQALYDAAEARFVQAKGALDTFEKRPKWVRALQNVLGRKQERLKRDFNEAARDLLEAKAESTRVEHEERFRADDVVREHNEQARARQNEAVRVRDELEQPLRDGMLERHRAEAALTQGQLVEPIDRAPHGQALTYEGLTTIGGESFQQLRSTDGRTFLGDRKDPKNLLAHSTCVRGETFTLDPSADGSLSVRKTGRVDAWDHERGSVQGIVGAIVEKDGKLERFQVSDLKSGQVKWVMPSRSHGDLRKELGITNLADLRPGTSVHLHRGALAGLDRAQGRDTGRGGR